jgi:hypothetical protein
MPPNSRPDETKGSGRGVMSIQGWNGEWIQTPGNHVIRYVCPEQGCGEFFEVKPGTSFKHRDELAACHSANDLVAEAEQFLKNKGKS